MLKPFAALVLAASLAGCASAGTAVSDQNLQQFKRGVTTEQDVIAKLGAPKSTGVMDDGNRVDMFRITRGGDDVEVVDLVTLLESSFGSRTKGSSADVFFTFDKSGVLTGYSVISRE
jgi:outer membrane protein assembly factor BamE (lipoprotein component of BamABCDE complex)